MLQLVRAVLIAAVALATAPTTPAPLARAGHVMTTSSEGGVLLFGGQLLDRSTRPPDSLWQWNGRTWESRGVGPANRTLPAAAFDSDRSVLVVYGGSLPGADGHLNETWEWSRSGGWRMLTGPSPGPRDHHAMVYDAARKRVVMFGGGTDPGTFLDDTWTWDGTAWTKLDAPGPPALVHHAMAYDTARRKVVMFGGFDSASANAGLWEFDGTRWERITPEGLAPEPRRRHRLAYDAGRGEVVMFGGTESTETWTWNGTHWTRHDAPAPPPRSVPAMAHDVARKRVVLFGGRSLDGKGTAPLSYLADTWEWDGSAWKEIK